MIEKLATEWCVCEIKKDNYPEDCPFADKPFSKSNREHVAMCEECWVRCLKEDLEERGDYD